MDFSRLRPLTGPSDEQQTTHVQVRRDLARLLAFAGWTIDDVVSNPIAKRDVYRWFKTDRRLHRRMEVVDLERQWNPLR
ncbi:MAG TPA: hypothetical protein VF595_05445 [Tepidisphaeraceae bacterium]